MSYVTQYRDARKEMDILNRKFFHLPKIYLPVRLHYLKNDWAFAYESADEAVRFTALARWYPSYRFFRSIVAHELIHHWQLHHGIEPDHDETFFSWKPILEPLGYSIEEIY